LGLVALAPAEVYRAIVLGGPRVRRDRRKLSRYGLQKCAVLDVRCVRITTETSYIPYCCLDFFLHSVSKIQNLSSRFGKKIYT